jgi:hypothetical protein
LVVAYRQVSVFLVLLKLWILFLPCQFSPKDVVVRKIKGEKLYQKLEHLIEGEILIESTLACGNSGPGTQ